MTKNLKHLNRIKWDADKATRAKLPKDVWVPAELDDDQIADWFAKNYGVCVGYWSVAKN